MTDVSGRLLRRTAFTLVEVLATLTLAAIILPVAMRGIALATSASGQAKRQMEAASLAEEKLAELVATGGWQGTDLSGDFGEDWPGYRWRADVSDWNGTGLEQVTVSVQWSRGGTQRSVALATLVYDEGQ
ncbi:MAG: type II secretion system protein [Planctomycetota bacterium]